MSEMDDDTVERMCAAFALFDLIEQTPHLRKLLEKVNLLAARRNAALTFLMSEARAVREAALRKAKP